MNITPELEAEGRAYLRDVRGFKSAVAFGDYMDYLKASERRFRSLTLTLGGANNAATLLSELGEDALLPERADDDD